MTLRVDKAGRVILPRSLRDRSGLNEGSAPELRETTEGLLQQPEPHRPSLAREGPFLVHAGALPRGYDKDPHHAPAVRLLEARLLTALD